MSDNGVMSTPIFDELLSEIRIELAAEYPPPASALNAADDAAAAAVEKGEVRAAG